MFVFGNNIDCIFSYTLSLQNLNFKYLLWLSLIFIIIPFITSCIIAIRFIIHWLRSTDLNSDRLVLYLKKYDKLILIFTIISGFYPSIDLLTSKLFPYKIFYFPLMREEKEELNNYRFINIVLLENIPQFGIQIIYILTQNSASGGEISEIVYISMIFSILSLCYVILSQISLICKILKPREEKFTHITKMDGSFRIQSNELKSIHSYSNNNISSCIDGVLSNCIDNNLWKNRSDITYQTIIYYIKDFHKSLAQIECFFQINIMQIKHNEESQVINKFAFNIKEMSTSGSNNYRFLINVKY